MNPLIQNMLSVALVNAICVVPLAILAWCVSRAFRQPAITHALWILVLVKLVTPPLFQLPVTINVPQPAASEIATSAAPARLPVTDMPAKAVRAASSIPLEHAGPKDQPDATSNAASTTVSAIAPQEPASFTTWSAVSTVLDHLTIPMVLAFLAVIWLCGSMAWLSWQGLRAFRFRNCVRSLSRPSAMIDSEVTELARRLGLRRVPKVLLVDATISPMLWGWGRNARMLFPAALLERMDSESRAALLTHELAHYRRGDHWIRILELAAIGLFWWHPVAWWARREIEESEEECCDALVIRQLAGSPRSYASALLDTIDFLCEPGLALPPAASGLGTVTVLRRRLKRILHEAPAKVLSRRLRCGLTLVAAGVLPLQPFAFAALAPTMDLANSAGLLDAVPGGEFDPAPTENDEDASMPMKQQARPGEPAPIVPRSRRGERDLASAVSPRGRFLVEKTTGYQTKLVDLTTNAVTDLSPYDITCLAFLPDDQTFLAADSDRWISLWDAPSGKVSRKLLQADHVVRSIAASPDGRSFAIGGRNGLLTEFDLGTGSPILDLSGQYDEVNCVRYSPQGDHLAVAAGGWVSSGQGRVSVWNLANGTVESEFDYASSPGAAVFVSDDELIVGLWDGQASLINLRTKSEVGSAHARKEMISAAAFSPDNPLLQNIRFQKTADTYASRAADLIPFLWPGSMGNTATSKASR